MTSWLHAKGQTQKLCFQVRFQRLNFTLNACCHITQELVISRVQNSRQRGNLNLPIDNIVPQFHPIQSYFTLLRFDEKVVYTS